MRGSGRLLILISIRRVSLGVNRLGDPKVSDRGLGREGMTRTHRFPQESSVTSVDRTHGVSER